MKRSQTFSLVSLGCPKALIDSEIILGSMVCDGYLLSEEPSEADVVILNTCCFINEATEESLKAISDILTLKSKGEVKRVVVYGCMAERYRSALITRFPEIDVVVGIGFRDSLPELCGQILSGGKPGAVLLSGVSQSRDERRTRLRITPKHYGYLKISEGCRNRCSYCVIPQIRGDLCSRSIDAVITEAEELVEDGVVEINLVAQDTAAFGLDRGWKDGLVQLVSGLSGIEKVKWIRLLYVHPAHLTSEIIDTVAGNDKVVNYIDMPIQHASDKVLKMMRRNTSKRHLLNLIATLRDRIEGVVIRTTLMVGFPGETESDFEELLDFVKLVKLDRLGAFAYSPEDGTVAINLPDQVPEKVRQERFARLMAVQQEIAFARNRELIGKMIQVIVDRSSENADLPWVGRSYGDAPDIDNGVFFTDDLLRPGEIFMAEVLEARGYDLVARRVVGG